MVVVPIAETSDVLRILAILSQIAEEVPWPRDIRVEVSDPELALRDPEQYRSDILQALRAYLDKIRNALGSEVQFEITGLMEPVQVEKLSDKEAYVSLPTEITVKAK
jgi:hypothetical protein